MIALGLFLGTSTSYAQLSKDQIKERKEIKKMAKADLKAKVDKQARSEAKKMKKEGWKTSPGALPIERQLDKAWTMEYEFDDDNFPKYITGEGMAVGANYNAAKLQAEMVAKQTIAGRIQTEICALIEASAANNELGQDEAVSVSKMVMEAKGIIEQNIGRTIPLTEVYRDKNNKNKEVLVRLGYNSQMAKAAAKKALQKDLESQGDALKQKLDKALGW